MFEARFSTVRALALGAKMVMIGRPWVWALGARGGAGVAHVLSILEKEIRVAMALTGASKIADVDANRLVHGWPANS
mgnify:CR=1 FL=1